MASPQNILVTLPLLLSVKDELEKMFQSRMSCELQKGQKRRQELVERVEVLEGELVSSKNQVGNLRSALIAERKNWREAEESAQKLNKAITELQKKFAKLEEKIVKFEGRPTGPQAGESPPGDGVLDVLNELVSDTTSNFERWNGRQAKLEEEVEGMKEVLDRLTTVALPPVPVAPATAMIENSNGRMILEEQTTINPVTSSSHLLQVPPSSPSVAADNPTPTPNRGRDPRWNMEHGIDPLDSSRKSCLCGFLFKCTSSLGNHIFYYTQEWKFSCKFCHKRFVSYIKLKNHLLAIHGVEPTAAEEKMVGCRRCGAVLKTRLQYKKHRRIVHKKGEALGKRKCAVSRKNAAKQLRGRPSPNTLHGIDKNRRQHCLCGRKFVGGAKLRGYITYYSRRERFQCRFCDKGFEFNCRLKVHMAKFHNFQTTMQVKQERVEVWVHE